MIKTIEQNPDIYNKVSVCEQNYQLFKKLNSPFGEIVILKSYVTLQEIFVKEKRFKCFETFKENITRAKQRISLKNSNLIECLDYSTIS